MNGIGRSGPIVYASIAVIIDSITNFVLDPCAASARVDHVLVDSSITIIVGIVADLDWSVSADPARVQHAFIDSSITIFIFAVTDFFRVVSAFTTGVQNAFVNASIAIVIDAVAIFPWNGFVENARECDAQTLRVGCLEGLTGNEVDEAGRMNGSPAGARHHTQLIDRCLIHSKGKNERSDIYVVRNPILIDTNATQGLGLLPKNSLPFSTRYTGFGPVGEKDHDITPTPDAGIFG